VAADAGRFGEEVTMASAVFEQQRREMLARWDRNKPMNTPMNTQDLKRQAREVLQRLEARDAARGARAQAPTGVSAAEVQRMIDAARKADGDSAAKAQALVARPELDAGTRQALTKLPLADVQRIVGALSELPPEQQSAIDRAFGGRGPHALGPSILGCGDRELARAHLAQLEAARTAGSV
jgi:hypothetical protein